MIMNLLVGRWYDEKKFSKFFVSFESQIYFFCAAMQSRYKNGCWLRIFFISIRYLLHKLPSFFEDITIKIIETLIDEDSKALLMWADLGWYFDIKNIKDNFKELSTKLFYRKKEVGPISYLVRGTPLGATSKKCRS